MTILFHNYCLSSYVYALKNMRSLYFKKINKSCDSILDKSVMITIDSLHSLTYC